MATSKKAAPKKAASSNAKPKKAAEKKASDPCWNGYEQKGTKKKAGKVVPNCVPE